MARNRDDLNDSFATDDSGSWLTRFLADEDEFDRRTKWRLASWAVGSVGAVVLAILASQSTTQWKREQVASADLARQAQLIQRLAKETQTENSRLTSAIDTLNGDRDRLYSRLGTLELGLESVTGSVGQRTQTTVASFPPTDKPVASAPAVAAPLPAPAAALTPAAPAVAPIAPVETQPVAAASVAPTLPAEDPNAKPATEQAAAKALPGVPLMPPKSIMAPLDPAAAKLVESQPPAAAPSTVASANSEPEPDAPEPVPIPVQRTEFGVDLGGANSIEGLRTLWIRLSKSNKVLGALRPIIMVKERVGGGGTQLRLVAGPLNDAATAAKFCAILTGGDRFCETSVFDGQRLATGISPPPASTWPGRKRASLPKVISTPEPPPAPKPSSLTSFLGIR